MNVIDRSKQSALFAAATWGHDKCVTLLLQFGADVNMRGKDGRTPLFAASQWGHYMCVVMLLIKGADPNITDDFGRYPKDIAREYRHSDICEILQVKHEEIIRELQGEISDEDMEENFEN